jgi:hypothetical protein
VVGVQDIVPLARDVIFEGMCDGVMVLDNQDRIVDFTPRLQDIFPDIGKMSVGKLVYDALITYPAFLKLLYIRPKRPGGTAFMYLTPLRILRRQHKF